MAHPSQIAFFKLAMQYFPAHFDGAVLDVGALDINGGPHLLMSPSRYVGADIGDGPNISHVGRGENLSFATGEFDVAMSSECFEHNPDWRGTLHNMVRMTRPSGLIIFSCASKGRAEHGTSRSDGGFSAPLATDIGQEYYANVRPRQVRECISGTSVDGSVLIHHKPFSDLLFLGIRAHATDSDMGQLLLCGEDMVDTFGGGRYPGALARHLVVSTFGDSGARLYLKAARLAALARSKLG